MQHHILLIGGTGKIGRPTARALAELGASVRVLTRYETKAAQLEGSITGFVADLNRSYSVAPAFNGIDTLVLITSHCITETGQGLSAVANALAAGVRRIVFLSSAVGPGSMRIPHVASKAPIEHALITSRVEYTIVRSHSLFQNDRAVEEMITTESKYALPYGSSGVSRVDVRDVAQALANAALRSGHERRIYTIGSPERWTGESIARAYGVKYAGDDLEKWDQRVAASLPKWQRDDLRIMYRYYQECGMGMTMHDLVEQERLLGSAPRPFSEYVGERSRQAACACYA